MWQYCGMAAGAEAGLCEHHQREAERLYRRFTEARGEVYRPGVTRAYCASVIPAEAVDSVRHMIAERGVGRKGFRRAMRAALGLLIVVALALATGGYAWLPSR